MASSAAIGICFAVGTILRLSLFRSSAAGFLALRTEISNPLTSWEKAMEGVALADNDISPYNGDLFHETPVMLRFFCLVSKAIPKRIHYLFVIVDFLSGLALLSIGKHFSRYLLKKQVNDVKSYAIGVEKIILKRESVEAIQIALIAAHFLNPYSIAVCVGKSTAVFNNLLIFLTFMFMLQGKEVLCCIAIAMASYQSLYPIMLIVPAAIFFQTEKSSRCDKRVKANSSFMSGYGSTVTLGLVLIAGLFGLSYFMEGSTKFFYSTTGFIFSHWSSAVDATVWWKSLGVPDLSPNLGVFWYFFTEMFEHFRPFFICVFQINAFLYTVPLAVKLRDHPVFLAYVLVALMSIFKSYPSYADVAVFITLLPMWKHVFQFMRNSFIVTNMFVACTVLSPILWHLWIYAGSANANFYFAIALTFSTAQIFLITDLLFGFLRREYDLRNGLKHKLKDGKEAQVILD